MLSRRNLLMGLVSIFTCLTIIFTNSLSAASFEITELSRPLIGAIRWDAWYGGQVTEEVEESLSPSQYHFRLPWFAKIVDSNHVIINGDSQDIMDQEITYAAEAGINYWAFVGYAQNENLSIALKNYLNSGRTNDVKFCMILSRVDVTASSPVWAENLNSYIQLMKKPNYQTVLDERPLFYVFAPKMDESKYLGRVKEIRQKALSAGLKKPFFVYMGFNPKENFKDANRFGFDAISAYAYPGNGTYESMTNEIEEKFWNTSKKIGANVIPLASAGWDKRPRMDNPVPWEANASYLRNRTYVETATPQEIAQHIKSALKWTNENRQSNPANTIIIYAWNENDEGGWLIPTLGVDGTPDTSRLQAIRDMLQQEFLLNPNSQTIN